jgi:hypothetical protein
VPAERLIIERELLAPLPSLRASIGTSVTRKVDRLSCVRFGSARDSVPVRFIGEQVRLHVDPDRTLSIIAGPDEGEVVAEHMLVAPGEVSLLDDHYGGPRPAPRRAVRPRTAQEKAFCALGPTAEVRSDADTACFVIADLRRELMGRDADGGRAVLGGVQGAQLGDDEVTALGPPVDGLDPEVAELGLEFMQANLTPELRGGAFGPELPAPMGAGPYDRIAAFAGRRVTR